MKTLIIPLLLIAFAVNSNPISAKQAAADNMSSQDSLAFEIQRMKVNDLLDQRTQRFGHYDESLRYRTGIFGLKTRKDMQRSIDILLEIVQTDNEIFQETKTLLTFKDQLLAFREFEKSRIQELADEYDRRIDGYIQTIGKLQKDQEILRKEINRQKNKVGMYAGLMLLLILIVLSLVFVRYLIKQKVTKN